MLDAATLFPRRALVGVGLLWVVPWLALSVLGMRDDAPDMPRPHCG